MDYLIRFVQMHDSFREPEIEALSQLAGAKVDTLFYSSTSPFCLVRFPDVHDPEDSARRFISRSILSRGIYELWGSGSTYDELHVDVRRRSSHLWPKHLRSSFKFSLDAYLGKRTAIQQREIIDSFRYLGFKGKICLDNPEVEFVVFEEWDMERQPIQDAQRLASTSIAGQPVHRGIKRLFLGRKIALSPRHLIDKHDLKKRPYISTTSMDAVLALVTANLALASTGKLFFDPFVGTGGFMVAAAELGAVVFGSDIDGRSFRGKGRGVERGVGANFQKYGLQSLFGDCIISDLTHTPLRLGSSMTAERVESDGPEGNKDIAAIHDEGWIDGIICDPPYGVREGLKVLGRRSTMEDSASSDLVMIDGIAAYTLDGYVAPKKPYSFVRMLEDVLNFAARTLVVSGRLAFWMPTANDEAEIGIPQHLCLDLLHCSVQPFNKWSRRLLVYSRNEKNAQEGCERGSVAGRSADELNPFRRKYFKGFEGP